MKKVKPFTAFLTGFSLVLTSFCFFGWYQVEKFADNLEITLQNNAQKENTSISTEEATTSSEKKRLLEIEEYPEFRELALEVAEKYAKFTSGDLDFSEIEPYFQENSDILIALESYSSRRYDDHDAVFVENLVFHSLYEMNEGELLARVTFDYLVEVDGVILEYPSDYSIYFNEISKKITALAMN